MGVSFDNASFRLQVSYMNAFSSVIWADFLSAIPILKKLEDSKQLKIIKLVGAIYSVTLLSVGYWVSLMSGVIEAVMLVISAFSGQIIGIFSLAILVPCANWKGTSIGMTVSFAMIMWMTIGRLVVGGNENFLPTSVEGCDNATVALVSQLVQYSDTAKYVN